MKMKYQYKLIINGHNVYKEYEISNDMESIKIGTTPECELRLNKGLFFEDIEISLERELEDKWSISCSEHIYISKGDMRKIVTSEIKHGDTMRVFYSKIDEEIFSISFMFDFETFVPNYNWKVDLKERGKISIGDKKSNDIVISSKYTQGNVISLFLRSDNQVILKEEQSQYGIIVNGTQINGEVALKDYDFIQISEYFFFLRGAEIYFDKNGIIVQNINFTEVEKSESGYKYPLFNRNTRVRPKLSDEKIEFLDAPDLPKKQEMHLVQTLLPPLMMAIVVVVSMGMMNGGGAFALMSVCSVGMGIVTTILGVIYGKKDYKKECFDRKKTYTAYVEKKRAEIEEIRQQEVSALNEIFYDTDREISYILGFHRSLFDRKASDDDYLCLYVGRGDKEAKRKIDYKKKDTIKIGDELTQIPSEMSEWYKDVKAAPITIDLKDVNAIGIIGDDKEVYEYTKNLVIDIVSRQYYTDAKLVMLSQDIDRYHWIKYLPNIYASNGTRNIVYNNESRNYVFENLYRELNTRYEMLTANHSELRLPHILILVIDEFGIKNHPISRFIENAKDLQVTFMFFENRIDDLPQNCNRIIKIQDDRKGSVLDVCDNTKEKKFTYTTVSDEVIQRVTQKLAPVYCEEVTLEGTLTKNITLFELLNIYTVTDIDLGKRWESSQIYKTMAAPLGINAKKEVVCLDLHEKFHGPHGLVAGTTGSGKSEILQSYIMSAATLFHPYEIGFMIIDFKGGGMANQFRKLPHLIGTITNIDGNEVVRSLKSIKAELMKRQALFAEANVNHIDKYIKKYKEGEVSVALPHLVIIVDEFAELKAEQPDFMRELISAARIGRSLGVHLILATQKPSGVVDDQIWSNSKFKLCLKVQSPSDSNEVIKTPLAAEIKEPGRAYLQVGNNEIFELFQSAYSGGSAEVDDSVGTKAYSIYELNAYGMRKTIFERKQTKSGQENSETQLDVLVNYIADYCQKNNIERLPSICLPPLPTNIDYVVEAKEYKGENVGYYAKIGLLDDPDRQIQEPNYINITEKNVVIIGSAQTGKTNLIQTMIRSLAEHYTPSQINIYVIDFGSMVLKNFDGLSHVGGVACATEEEKIKNLFKLLDSEITNRKEILADVGVSSFSSYLEAELTELPQIVVFIDNFNPLRELYLSDDDFFMPMLQDGISVGISFVITNSQTSGLGYRYFNSIEGRVALFCNDNSEYSSVIDGCRMSVPNVPGRALVKVEKTAYEAQVYMAFQGEKEIERVQAIKDFVEEMNQKYPNEHAKRIPEIPKLLDETYIKNEYPTYVEKDKLLLGLNYETIMPVTLDILTLPFLAIVGSKDSGKRAFLEYMMKVLFDEKLFDIEVYCFDGLNKTWEEYAENPRFLCYETIVEKSLPYFEEIEERVEARYNAVAQSGMEVIENEPIIILLIENNDLISAMNDETQEYESFKNIVTRYKDMRIFTFLTNVQNEEITYSSPEILKLVENANLFLIFEEIGNIKCVDLPYGMAKRFSGKMETEDAYFICDHTIQKTRTVISSMD